MECRLREISHQISKSSATLSIVSGLALVHVQSADHIVVVLQQRVGILLLPRLHHLELGALLLILFVGAVLCPADDLPSDER